MKGISLATTIQKEVFLVRKNVSVPFGIVLFLLLADFWSIVHTSDASPRDVFALLFATSGFGVANFCNKELRKLLKAWHDNVDSERLMKVIMNSVQVPAWLIVTLVVGALYGFFSALFGALLGFLIIRIDCFFSE